MRIIMEFFIDGAQALFSLRTLFGAMLIHSYTRMSSLIRMRQSDFFCDEKATLSARKALGTTVPWDENLPTCAQLEPPTYYTLERQH